MEKRQQVITVRVSCICDSCGVGEMVVKGGVSILMSNPPQHIHICNHCGTEQMLQCLYPRIEYVDEPKHQAGEPEQTISREELLAADRQAREEIANFLGTTLED